jgi:hypothetical protein
MLWSTIKNRVDCLLLADNWPFRFKTDLKRIVWPRMAGKSFLRLRQY